MIYQSWINVNNQTQVIYNKSIYHSVLHCCSLLLPIWCALLLLPTAPTMCAPLLLTTRCYPAIQNCSLPAVLPCCSVITPLLSATVPSVLTSGSSHCTGEVVVCAVWVCTGHWWGVHWLSLHSYSVLIFSILCATAPQTLPPPQSSLAQSSLASKLLQLCCHSHSRKVDSQSSKT